MTTAFDNWVDEFARDILRHAAESFMENFDPEASEQGECSIPPMMMATRVFPEGVKPPSEVPEGKTAIMAVMVPDKVVSQIFKNNQTKGMAVFMADKMLTSDMPWPHGDPGPAEAVFVASEAWTARYKDEKERENYSSVKEMPSAQSAIIVCVYQAASMSLYVQRFNSDGSKDGEPIVEQGANVGAGQLVRSVVQH